MYFGKKHEFDWTFSVIVSDILALGVAFSIESGFQGARFGAVFHHGVPLGLRKSLLLALILLYAMRYFGLYTWRALTQVHGSPLRIALVAVLSSIGFVGFQQFFFGTVDVSEVRSLEWIALFVAVLVWAFRFALRFMVMDLLGLIPHERIVFIGWSPRVERVLQAFRTDVGRFQTALGFIHEGIDPSKDIPFEKGFKALGPLSQIEKILVREQPTLLIVDEANMEMSEINQIGEVCSRCLVNFKVIPSSFDILTGKLSLRVVAGVPLLGVAGLRYDRYHNRIAKRAVDILGALVGLALSGPVIAVCAWLIKRESPGPAFYRQVRLGMQGRRFEMIKLRTMRLDAEKETGPKWAVAGDDRRLKIGAFLRKTNLDETPQFWNVLRGDMSLVGPRPERPEFVEQFRQTIRHYNLRHSCRPGLTGWAAINGLRGNTSLVERIEYDLFYIENWSLPLDFQIMAMTFFPPKNAY